MKKKITKLEDGKLLLPIFSEAFIVLELDKVTNVKALDVLINHMKKGEIKIGEGFEKSKFKNYINTGKFKKTYKKFTPTAKLALSESGIEVKVNFFEGIETEMNKNGFVKSGSFYTKDYVENEVLKYKNNEIKIIDQNNYKSIYTADAVFMFINHPTLGGIYSTMLTQKKYLRSKGLKNIYLVFEDYSEEDLDLIINFENDGWDDVFEVSSVNLKDKLNKNNNLLIFYQNRIASHFQDYFTNNFVIIEYHRNIMHIDHANKNMLLFFDKTIENGQIRILDSKHMIDKVFGKTNNFVSFKNFIFPEKNFIQNEAIDEIRNIVYVGRLTDADKSKNIKGLIRIIKHFESNANIKFHIYGDGELKDTIEHNCPNAFTYGKIYDKNSIYENKDLLILPSIQEAYPLVLLEAFSYGIKVVSYDSSNMISEIISDDVGFIIENENESDFIKKIEGIKGYEKASVRQYFDNKFNFSNIDNYLNLTLYNKNTSIINNYCYIYGINYENNNLKIKFFVGGYKVLSDEIYFNSNLNYELKSNIADSVYYSSLSKNFKENFYELCFNVDDFVVDSFLEVFYKGKRMIFRNVKQTFSSMYFENFKIQNKSDILLMTSIEENNVYEKIKQIDLPNTLLFQDRENKADDNAEHLYEYIMKQKTEFDIVFVIDHNSEDYLRLIKKGFKVIRRNSFLHIVYYLKSKYIVSSHILQRIITPKMNNNYMGLKKSKLIFLQHGVIYGKSDYKYFLNTVNNPVELMSVSSEYEKDLIESFSDYENIKITGLARYDKYSVRQEDDKFIFYFPTWNKKYNSLEFDENPIAINLKNVMKSDKLNEMLKKNQIKIKLVLHPEISTFSDKLKKYETEYILIRELDEILFSNYISNASMFITDASSVAFDFAYQKKPIINFAPYDLHTNNDIGEVAAFGISVSDIDELVDVIDNTLQDDFINLSSKSDKFFKYNDNKNSQRILEEIRKLD